MRARRPASSSIVPGLRCASTSRRRWSSHPDSSCAISFVRWWSDTSGKLRREGSPSMYCAGLLGLATGVAWREEKRTKAEQPKKDPPKDDPGAKKDPDDPFFNPPPKAGKEEPKKPAPRPQPAPAAAPPRHIFGALAPNSIE